MASLIIVALGDGPQRHSDLSRRVAGVGQEMVTPPCGRSNATAGVPGRHHVGVDYSLTPPGENRHTPVAGFKDRAEADVDIVGATRADYDARTPDLTIGPGGAS